MWQPFVMAHKSCRRCGLITLVGLTLEKGYERMTVGDLRES